MSKYNIISKDKGNKPNKDYKIVYQVKGQGNKRFEVELVCLGNVDSSKINTNKYGIAYAFMEGRESPHILTSKDRQEFINELYEFQTGAQYRHTHPIVQSEAEVEILKLKAIKAECIAKLEEVNKSIRQVEENSLKAEYEEMMATVDRCELDKLQKDIRKVWNNKKYSIEPNVFIHKYIMDKETNKPIAMLYENTLKELIVTPIDFEHYKQCM